MVIYLDNFLKFEEVVRFLPHRTAERQGLRFFNVTLKGSQSRSALGLSIWKQGGDAGVEYELKCD
jgi:hypothetical protein